MNLDSYIRDIPDFPKEGIIFKDITPLLSVPEAFKYVTEDISKYYAEKGINTVVGIESRGFIFGAALALQNDWKFVPVRKPGKLPYKTYQESYTLEYGENTLEIHQDALDENSKVLIIDDLLATGGTLNATVKLVERLGAEISGISTIIELLFLDGAKQFDKYDFYSLLKY